MNPGIKKSIKTKVLTVALMSLFVMAIVLSVSGGAMVDRLSKTNSQQLLTQICDERAIEISSDIELVYHSVNIIYKYAVTLSENSGVNVNSFGYLEQVRELALSVADETPGARSVYFRYNPELAGNGTAGFFWSKAYDDSKFKPEPPTDILAYNAADISHVGWFYIPKESGQPLWMSPYYNENIDVFMISYIIPFYLSNGEFVGVIGMDIDFDSIMRTTQTDKIYETGMISLVDLSEHLLYYSDAEGHTQTEKLSKKLYNHVTTINSTSELLRMVDGQGIASVGCWKKLLNGMVMYVSVPEQEIYSKRREMISYMVIFAVIISVAAAAVIWKNTEHVITPINRLVEITKKYAKGEWGERYISYTNDELEELSESVSVMAEQTKEYMDRLNGLARTDSLTGVKNATSYKEYIDAIKQNESGKYSCYAIAVMDINLLKKTNDTYGHEAGDLLIKEASRHICTTFKRSPVFRIGGDEFAVIITGEDYNIRADLCRAFDDCQGYSIKGYPDVPLLVSHGIAAYPEEGSSPVDIFKLADERMYLKKKEMKMQRES